MDDDDERGEKERKRGRIMNNGKGMSLLVLKGMQKENSKYVSVSEQGLEAVQKPREKPSEVMS